MGEAEGPGDSNSLPKSKERGCFNNAESIVCRPYKELLQSPVVVEPVRASSSERDEHTVNDFKKAYWTLLTVSKF